MPANLGALFGLGHDPYLLQKLVHDDLIKALRSDVKAMWRYAIARDSHERASQRMFLGAKTSAPAGGIRARRMGIYLSLERQVMDRIFEHLAAAETSHIIMHDGFMSRERVDVEKLVLLVKYRTGYDIRLSETQLGSQAEADTEPNVETTLEEVDVEEDGELGSDNTHEAESM